MKLSFKRKSGKGDFSNWEFLDDFSRLNKELSNVLDQMLWKRFETIFTVEAPATLNMDIEQNGSTLEIGCRIDFDDMGCYAEVVTTLRELIKAECRYSDDDVAVVIAELRSIALDLETDPKFHS